MGHGQSTSADYTSRAAYRASTGTSFQYSQQTASAPAHLRKVHESLDPKRLNSLGWKGRECLDSTDHPLTIPVVVAFDETGSMGSAPMIIQQKLSSLKGITLRAGLPDAQLCFGAYGDSKGLHEVAPCQIGQFESAVTMEEWLNNLYLEGNGGGNGGESAGLLLYFLANFSKLDSVDNRGKKGYIFLTGDEISHPVISRQEISHYIGEDVEADVKFEDVVAKVKESYDVYFFLVETGSSRSQGSEAFWKKHLGNDHVIVVENLDNISEMVGMMLAACEGVVTNLDAGIDLLKAEGVADTVIMSTSKALANWSGYGNGTVVKTAEATSGSLATTAGDGSMERL